ncbi:MAG: hypothetical protein JRH20_10850 [Deltaproteobacteria bacterium]|nr:hypothetical protein [Deltaproteobacteria bacterium]
MKTPTVTQSTDALHDLHVYTTAQLKAETETKDLAAHLQRSSVAMNEAQTAHDLAHDAMIAQLAMRVRADDAADDVLRQVYLQLRSFEGSAGGKATGKVAQLFPHGLRGATDGPITQQPGVMGVLAARLGKFEDPEINAYSVLVERNAEELDRTVAGYEAAIDAVTVAYGDVVNARAEWIRQYEKTYGELVVRRGKKKAELYFRKAAPRRSAKKA